MKLIGKSGLSVGLTVGIVALTAGCVTKSTYLKAKNEASGLQTQLKECHQSNDALNQKLSQTSTTAAELAKQKADQEHLLSDLKDQVAAGQVQVTQLAGKLSINMVDKILFASGSAQIKPDGQEVLKKVGQAILNIKDKRIWVGGHTDNVPISPLLRKRFPTNWELSTARATSVVRFLETVAGIPGNRLIASGYSDTQPVADNNTPEGREQNRRIEILLIPLQDDFRLKKGVSNE